MIIVNWTTLTKKACGKAGVEGDKNQSKITLIWVPSLLGHRAVVPLSRYPALFVVVLAAPPHSALQEGRASRSTAMETESNMFVFALAFVCEECACHGCLLSHLSWRHELFMIPFTHGVNTKWSQSKSSRDGCQLHGLRMWTKTIPHKLELNSHYNWQMNSHREIR